MSTQPPVWLLTGCSSPTGFGYLLALHALKNHHRVIATSRTPSKHPELIANIENQGGKWMQLDVTSPEELLKKKVVEAIGYFGQVDYLVNAAGIAILGAGEYFSESEINHQLRTNTIGPILLTSLLIPHFRSRGSGTIIQISSGAGIEGLPSRSLYAMSKFALEGWTESVWREMKPFGVRVFLVELGWFNSGFAGSCGVQEREMGREYGGSEVERMVEGVKSGGASGRGARNDVKKGCAAIWDVATKTGLAEGMEEEFLRLPLGEDAIECWERVGELRNKTLEGTRKLGESCGVEKTEA